jgi:hypothetical protein
MKRFVVCLGILIFSFVALPSLAWAQGGCILKQSTATQEVNIGPFLDSSDGDTEKTGLTIANTDIRLKVNGSNWASKNSGGATHEEHGNYRITLDATDTATVGMLEIDVHVSGALFVFRTCFVYPANVYDALFGADVLDVNISKLGDVTQSATDLKDFADTGYDPSAHRAEANVSAMASAVITTASIASNAFTASKFDPDVTTEFQTGLYGLQKNVASQEFHFFMFDNTTGVPTTGLTTGAITCEISKDHAAYATTNDTTEAEIGHGEYYITLTQSETNANDVSIVCNATGYRQSQATSKPQH